MIQKKSTLSVVGRRNKQQILKDVIRPPPSAIISSPDFTISSVGNRGGCSTGSTTEGAPVALCVETFSRTIPLGDGWGTSEFFDLPEWEDHGAPGNNAGVQGGFGVLADGSDLQCEAPMSIPMGIKLDFKLDGNPANDFFFDLFCFHDYDLNVGFYTDNGDAFIYVVNGAAFNEAQVSAVTLGTMYSIRFEITESSLSAAFWEAGTTEPAPQATLSGTTLPVSSNELRITTFGLASGDTVQFDRIETVGTLIGDTFWIPRGGITTTYCSFDDFYFNSSLAFSDDAWMGFHPSAADAAHGEFSNELHVTNTHHFMKSILDINDDIDTPSLTDMGLYDSLEWSLVGNWNDDGPDEVTFSVYSGVAETVPVTEPPNAYTQAPGYWNGGTFLFEATLEYDSIIGGKKHAIIPIKKYTTADFGVDSIRYETLMTDVGLDLRVGTTIRGVVGCEPVITRSVGYFNSTLIENDDGWAPPNPPAYYTDVFFDGAHVFEDDHYTIDGDMNVVPNVGIEPALVQARYVIR